MTAVIGLVMLALPVGIIATAFADVIHRREFVVTWGMIARVPALRRPHGRGGRPDHAPACARARSSRARSSCGGARWATPCTSSASGQVEIELPQASTSSLGEGQFFGEIAVLKNTRRNATVRATARTQLLVLDSSDLRALMTQRPDIAARIHEVARTRASRTSTVMSPDTFRGPGEGGEGE